VNRKVALDYLGCKVNQAEVDELGQRFQRAGFALASAHEDPDVYILNSCTVTHVADRKTRLLIHQMTRRYPDAFVIVTGCYSTVDPAAVQAIEGVDLVVPNAD
jgi:threonylcarbamoyladenosine tRNA methylthiotransferase MtaB